ncbi:MAG: S1-like domain-containing RNA-binding protein [Desulforhopalus sp.]|nr:S1-like domain-containing RNA-binding protein [Desulforhopalus sp.]
MVVEIGKINRLKVKGRQVYGIHLDGGESGDILLRGADISGMYRPGDEIDVFVYVDREGRLLASAKKPLATVGEFTLLKVVATSEAGAFVDWGLESDLLVPKSEQQGVMREGRSYVVYIFVSDKTRRITASTKLQKFLNRQPPQYREGEEVDLLVYAATNLGYSAVVNGAHIGMIYENEVFQRLAIGQRLKGYVKKVRDDRKIDLRLQQTGFREVDDISATILQAIRDHGGTLALTDKSPPEEIYDLFGVSKKVFKKAIGALYKKRRIVIDNDGIRLAG